MAQVPSIDMYSDLHCPYAYLAAYRLRELRDEWRGKVQINHKSLALEYVNRRPTPKLVLEMETPILLLDEPEIPFQPWRRPDSEWPVTIWPAFEAIKCAERQDAELANEYDWALRVAFFGESRCISLRHVLFEIAEGIGLRMEQFANDFDGGSTKRLVINEARAGWEQLHVEGSPTFVLASGEQRPYLGLPKVKLDSRQHFRPVEFTPAGKPGADRLAPYRTLIADAQRAA
ncbi:MAG: dithiol-disulfide isomerase [Herpetosiphon sp.]